MKGKCNECNRLVKDMNDLEIDELKKEGSFVCSDCINEEMEDEQIRADYMLNYIENHYQEVYDEAEAQYETALSEGERKTK